MGDVTPHPGPRDGALEAPCPISENHDLSRFDCGNADLNDWLQRVARKSDGRTARTYVVCAANAVVGYYCLAAGAIVRADMPTARLRANTPQQIPVIIIGRLAVDTKYQGQGIGSGMLKDALLRAVSASRTVGVRAVLVHAIDERAAAFYRGYGFVPSPANDRVLILPIETAIAALP